ncbi:MAG: phosphatidate cytidylyltransferase [Neptuniibacter caesariensis]|uniref:Phosphatidate cytidylyltransferase n=1 Tax=Neptuniibacter caesariensis TaxID=207954 RepID=A0A2G6JQR8_NEPCE|nr:MAG: phosphatidate cytidylyltransferase [Neptuniibacter caesariensis]
MLKQRILTACILAPVALICVFALPLSSFIYFLDFVILLAAWEWASLSGYEKGLKRHFYVLLMALAVFVMHLYHPYLPVNFILAGAVVAWLVALVWVVRYPACSSWGESWKRALIGFVVLLPCWLAFVGLKATEGGELLILFLFCIVWGADIGAYFSGKRFGRNKLAPNVSPGKTREGLYGGLVVTLLFAIVYALYNELTAVQSLFLLGLVAITALISVLGDLFESMLKRFRGIKDSSQLLPGHGGILDRIDSLTAAAPVFVLGMQFLV